MVTEMQQTEEVLLEGLRWEGVSREFGGEVVRLPTLSHSQGSESLTASFLIPS